MDVRRIEIFLNLAAAAGALSYAVVLIAQEGRKRIHARLGVLLMFLGAGVGARGLYELGAGDWANHVQYLGHGIFPLCAALYVESATGRSFHRGMKLVLLLGTAFFACTWPTRLVDARWWLLTMMTYQLVFLCYAAWACSAIAVRARTGPRRSYLVALALVSLLGAGFIVTDNHAILGFRGVRLGALSVLLVTWVAAHAFHDAGRWSVRALLRHLAAVTVAVALLCGLVALLTAPASIDTLAAVAMASAASYFVIDPLRLAWTKRQRRGFTPMAFRLSTLDTTSLRGCLASVQNWPEIREVKVLTGAELTEAGYGKLEDYFQYQPGLVDRQTARFFAQTANTHETAIASERVLDLMTRQNVDFVVPLRDGVVLIASEGVLDTDTYRQVLDPLAAVARLLSQLRAD